MIEQIAETLKLMNKTAIEEVAKGNYENALEIFEQSQELEEKLGFRLQVAESMVNMANIYLLMQDSGKCVEVLKKAEELFIKEKNSEGIFKVQQVLGELHFRSMDYDKAAQTYEKCLKMNIGNKERGISYFQAAVSYIKLKDNYKAQDYLGRALVELERTGEKTATVDCLRYRALVFTKIGRRDLAINDLRKAMVFAETQESKRNITIQMARVGNIE